MEWLITKNNRKVSLKNIPEISIAHFFQNIKSEIQSDKRVISFFGQKIKDGVKLFIVLADDEHSKIYLSSCLFNSNEISYPSLTAEFPSFHLFEREIYEEFGIIPDGHPWLKYVRYAHNRFDQNQTIKNHIFNTIDGGQVHQVGVGPVHAGIIEPGHFRFGCLGENICNLEAQFGYQHRGIETLIEKQKTLNTYLIESITGDSLIAQTTAYVNAIESLSNTHISRNAMKIRAIGLEMERIAMHIGDMSALSNDIAYLLGSSVFGATRTIVINTLLEICGSRFGKSLIQIGGTGYYLDKDLRLRVKKNLQKVLNDILLMEDTFFNAPSVLSRIEQTGTISRQDAEVIGLVGPAGRASGVMVDVRADHPFGIYQYYPVYKFVLETGDVFARAYIRIVEIKKSIELIEELLDYLVEKEDLQKGIDQLHPESLVVSIVESWRGELVHTAITDKEGNIIRYKIKDPSFNNWLGLTHCVRNNGISDFPVCNKSFNLSYCGFDL